MGFDLRAVARTYRAVVGGEPRIVRFGDDDDPVQVDVFVAEDRPQAGVTTWATLGMSRLDTDTDTADGRALRVELIGEVSSAVATFGRMLTDCARNLVGGEYGLAVDTVYPDIVRRYEPDVSTAHLLLTDVFSFEGLAPVEGDDEVLAFLQAVPVTDDEFAFARTHGVPALTELLERERADVLDLDRPSVVGPAEGAGSPGSAGGVHYGGRWDPLQRRTVPPLDEAEARRRYVEGPTFAVVLTDADDEVPRAVLDVDAGASRVLVSFFDDDGALWTTHLLRRRGERLFFEQSTSFQYSGDAEGLPYAAAHVLVHDVVWFRPDGTGRRVLDDASRPTIEAEDRRDLPVDDLWCAVPEFGDWSSLVDLQP